MKDERKRQKRKENHWVPQSYLKAFSTNPEIKKDHRRIWTLSKFKGEPQFRRIKKVAVKFYLYAPADNTGKRDYSFEEKLSDLERLFAHPAWEAISTAYADLCDDTTRKMVSLLTATMFLRNPMHLDLTRDMHRMFVEFFSQQTELPDEVEINGRVLRLDLSSWPDYRDANEEAIKRAWINDMNRATWLAKIMMTMRWFVLTSEAPTFITTDNPVALIGTETGPFGFRSTGALVMFPLSPTRLLGFDNRRHEPDGQYYEAKNPGITNSLL